MGNQYLDEDNSVGNQFEPNTTTYIVLGAIEKPLMAASHLEVGRRFKKIIRFVAGSFPKWGKQITCHIVQSSSEKTKFIASF